MENNNIDLNTKLSILPNIGKALEEQLLKINIIKLMEI